MTILHQCRLHLLQLGTQPCFDRLTAKQEALAIPRFSTDVGEPQKVEGLRFGQAPLLPIDLGVTPKFNQPGLVRMQAKTESLQAFPKVRQKTPCVPHVLESHHEVIRIANEDDFAGGVFLPLLVSPKIEDIMQVNIRQER